jgi:hypothetical protein
MYYLFLVLKGQLANPMSAPTVSGRRNCTYDAEYFLGAENRQYGNLPIARYNRAAQR